MQVAAGSESVSCTPEIVVWLGFWTEITPVTTNWPSPLIDGVTTTSYPNDAGVPSSTVCDDEPLTDFSIVQS